MLKNLFLKHKNPINTKTSYREPFNRRDKGFPCEFHKKTLNLIALFM